MAKVKKWDKVSYEEFKSSPELQAKAAKEFELEEHGNETYHDRDDNYNTKYVYNNFDDTLQTYDIESPNIRLLKEICKSTPDWKVKPRSHDKTSIARQLTKLQISLLIAEMFGYRHYQTARIMNVSQEKIKTELELAIKSIVKLGVHKCKTCKWRELGDHTKKADFCKFWKIKVRSNWHCWLQKEQGNGL